MIKQLYPSDSSNFPPLHWRNPAEDLTVTQAFTYISYVYNARKRSYTVYRQGNVVDDVKKWRQIASCYSAQWTVAEQNTIFTTFGYIGDVC